MLTRQRTKAQREWLEKRLKQCSDEPIAKDDVFMRNEPDRRLVTHLATDSWFDVVSYLPVTDIVPALPLTCRYFNNEVVWGKWSGRLMWREMGPGAIDAPLYTWPVTSILQRACDRRAPSTHVSILLDGNANVNTNEVTPLYHASKRGRVDIVNMLLASNADPNLNFSEANGEWSPLIVACFNGYVSVVSALISSGAKLDYQNDDGRTALIMACRWNKVECARVLLNARADIHVHDFENQTAMDHAIIQGNHEIVDMLMQSNHAH
jgi:predicted LPLAT superfamily acyltransferase